MTRNNIFICYSRKDRRALEELRTFLRPLERESVVDIWDDSRIQEGEHWRQQIELSLDSAMIGILLISQDFLASDFIVGKEIPSLLDRAVTAGAVVIPVFLSPSTVESMEFSLASIAGRRLRLVELQGVGSPTKTLRTLSHVDRKKEYVQLASRIQMLARTRFVVESLGRDQANSREISLLTDMLRARERLELTVELIRDDERLQRNYTRPSRWKSLPPIITPWREIETQLDEFQAGHLGNDFMLFDLLFGSGEEWKGVFYQAFDMPEGSHFSPIELAVRLRIVTSDPRLRSLPWGHALWKQSRLVTFGWTFELAAHAQPQREVVLAEDFSILVVTPAGDPLAAAVLELLGGLWRQLPARRIRIAHTATTLEADLVELSPQLILLSGPVTGPTLSLLLSAGEALRLQTLNAAFESAGHYPLAIAVQLEGATPSTLRGLPDLRQVPLVIWRQIPVSAVTSRASGWITAWLRQWLSTADDPVLALYDVQDVSGSQTGLVQSNYRHWSTILPSKKPARHWTALEALDRWVQKALVSSDLKDLVNNEHKRTLTLVSYAAPGNAVSALGKQLEHDRKKDADDPSVNYYQLEFPLHRHALTAALEDKIKSDLWAKANETISALLLRRAPRDLGKWRCGIVWLDWGTFGDGLGQQPQLEDADLQEWVHFSCERLAALCPPRTRVVSFLALELEKRHHEKLQRVLLKADNELCQNQKFTLTVLDPLSNVSERDLRRFLREHECPQALVGPIAELLHTQTRGRFEDTVRWLDRARATSWNDLHAALRGGASGPALQENELL